MSHQIGITQHVPIIKLGEGQHGPMKIDEHVIQLPCGQQRMDVCKKLCQRSSLR